MATHVRIRTTEDIVNGLITVASGAGPAQHYDPGVGSSQHLPSGDSLAFWQNLEKRFKVDPSGWSS